MRNVISLFLLFFTSAVFANQPASFVFQDLQKFSSLKKILYIAAHPDDENTRALAYFSLSENAETAYLSLTRGDGGQNLIGEELSEDLGVLRTQELLAARGYDGARQYFSKALDFGYSKSAEETFKKWGKAEILEDVVLMIRKFQPDVIITRFPPDERGGHGHHTASAVLALEAFEKAGDASFLPEQVEDYGNWNATAIYWNASNWWNNDLDSIAANNPDYLIKDIGGYNALLGQSYNEIGTIARSQHKCQGFGAVVERGSRIEYFQYLAGEKLQEDFFEKNTRSWTNILDKHFEQKLQQTIDNFDFKNIENNVNNLIALRTMLNALPASTFKTNKMAMLDQLIFDCLGLYFEISATDYAFSPSENMVFALNAINRSNQEVILKSIDGKNVDKVLPGQLVVTEEFTVENDQPISNPYWLDHPFVNTFQVNNKEDLLKAENDATFQYEVAFSINGVDVTTNTAAEYIWRDPSYGERRRDVISAPDYTVNFNEASIILQAGESKNIELKIHGFKSNLSDHIIVEAPDHWIVDEDTIAIDIENKHGDVFVNIVLTPTDSSQSGTLLLKSMDGAALKSYTEIVYDHIPTQVIFKPAQLKCVKIDAKIKPGKIAYIQGVEDGLPKAIRQLGFEVDVYEVSDLSAVDLTPYQSVVLGIRIYNVHGALRNFENKLFSYVEAGGNLVMQYNTASWRGPAEVYGGPVPFEISRNRVTEEDAAVTFLAPDHAIMNFPNKISQKDFDHWVQERGLYFAANYDHAYQPIFSMHDEGEEEQLGALIVADYGSGRFIYTGISFFRELPNGVEGAYRLFANLLSYE